MKLFRRSQYGWKLYFRKSVPPENIAWFLFYSSSSVKYKTLSRQGWLCKWVFCTLHWLFKWINKNIYIYIVLWPSLPSFRQEGFTSSTKFHIYNCESKFGNQSKLYFNNGFYCCGIKMLITVNPVVVALWVDEGHRKKSHTNINWYFTQRDCSLLSLFHAWIDLQVYEKNIWCFCCSRWE